MEQDDLKNGEKNKVDAAIFKNVVIHGHTQLMVALNRAPLWGRWEIKNFDMSIDAIYLSFHKVSGGENEAWCKAGQNAWSEVYLTRII